jgi:hypothetical protein
VLTVFPELDDLLSFLIEQPQPFTKSTDPNITVTVFLNSINTCVLQITAIIVKMGETFKRLMFSVKVDESCLTPNPEIAFAIFE